MAVRRPARRSPSRPPTRRFVPRPARCQYRAAAPRRRCSSATSQAASPAAQPQIDWQAGPPADGSFGTGGGWIPGEVGGHANFGVVGGVQPDGSLKAHVVYDDHSTSFTFKSTTISTVDNSIPCQTTITG